ncbi:hypothetical protein HU200_013775 [Digitaria exilis]|uniref:Uncharacterized protein n=1 Tax=Digitaria exilis TaxID=1010633 RepID=A0A835FC71_9POAL|nr:hypothetical protein HU200_013775 [Digitaria exilis]
MLHSLQHADHMDAGETHYSQAEVVRASKAKFDEQLCRVYTRAVYNQFKKEYNNSTAFLIELNPLVRNGWLVKHQNGGGNFCWADHEFKVVANKESGEYTCECKQWEHTGSLFGNKNRQLQLQSRTECNRSDLSFMSFLV